MAATLAQQLESVQAAIEAIEGGAQSASSEGESLTWPNIEALYKERQRLENKKARADRDDITAAEF